MANILELFALVQTTSDTPGAPYLCVVRTYESKPRAEQDLELVSEKTNGTYKIITIPHIES